VYGFFKAIVGNTSTYHGIELLETSYSVKVFGHLFNALRAAR